MAEFSTVALLTLFGSTIIIGYLGNLIFQKSRVPNVIWLMFFGVLIGPVLGLIDPQTFTTLTPFLSSLALLIILFDSGLHMNIYSVIRDAPRGLALAVSGIALSMVFVGLITSIFMGINIIGGLLVGAILGGTSSPIVLSLVKESGTEGKIKNMLSLESALTDALTIIVALFLIQYSRGILSAASPTSILPALLGPFSIGAMVGLLVGLLWLFILDKLRGIPFSHMLTLSIAFLLYALVEVSGGSGPLAALFFGIVLGNGKNFSTMLKFKKIFEVGPHMKMFQDEIAFFIRSFFFVLLGLMVVVNITIAVAGFVISLVLILGRIVTAEIGMVRLHIPNTEKYFVRTMAPRGLAAAVLAQILKMSGVIPLGVASMFADIIFIVILVTVTYSSAMTIIVSRKIERNGLPQENAAGKNKKVFKKRVVLNTSKKNK